MTEITLTIRVRVDDETALRAAARKRSIADGDSKVAADEYLNPDLTQLTDCAFMLLHPDYIPPSGMTILESGAV